MHTVPDNNDTIVGEVICDLCGEKLPLYEDESGNRYAMLNGCRATRSRSAHPLCLVQWSLDGSAR